MYKDAKVLIVDDNSVNLYVLEKMLEPYGIVADAASSGPESIARCRGMEYDLIFMDHMMPGQDGIETLNILKQNENFKTPVIVLTGNTEDGIEDMYLKAGFVAYMKKPVNNEVLGQVLDRFLGNDANNGEVDAQAAVSDNPKRDKMIACGFEIIDTLLETGISIESYEEMLSIFAEESRELIPQCEEYANDLNMREYSVIVHGLKNDAAMISDNALSDHARKHEIESKADNKDFVKRNWHALKKHWEKTIGRIEKYFE